MMMLVTLLTATAMMTTAPATSLVVGVLAFSSSSSSYHRITRRNSLSALRLSYYRGQGDRGGERRITRRSRHCNDSIRSSSNSKLLAAARFPSIATSSSAIEIMENSAATATATTVSNLAVSLDRPLLSPMEFSYRNPSTGRTAAAWWISSFMSVLVSDIFKTACVAFIVAAGVSLLPRLIATTTREDASTTKTTTRNDNDDSDATAYSDDDDNNDNNIEGGMASYTSSSSSSSYVLSTIRQLSSKATTIINGLQQMATSIIVTTISKKKSSKYSSSSSSSSYSVPMPFTGDGNWNKCTLSSRTPGTSVGSTYSIYEFTLPETYYTLSLGLGQQLEFCCLGPNDEICTGSFYLYDGSSCGSGSSSTTNALSVDGNNDDDEQRKKKMKKKKSNKHSGSDMTATTGVVRIVLSNDKMVDEGNSMFMDVLRNTLQPGDEVAIRPGKTHLSYRGKHTPVTDMVYMAYGLGIVPVLDQVRAITPRGSSTVVVSSVTWFNSVRDDFDLAMDDLEYEYMKYPGKLAVSCILEDVLTNPLEGNVEVEESVPYFNPGTMAVICGPKRFTEKARGYLMRRGYPENCICILP